MKFIKLHKIQYYTMNNIDLILININDIDTIADCLEKSTKCTRISTVGGSVFYVKECIDEIIKKIQGEIL